MADYRHLLKQAIKIVIAVLQLILLLI
ncbi:small toxic protein shoB [Salmonella enterica subsp. enterica serovar Sandiego]|nr:small toxic protein shoB [Salmonella enterica]EDQ0146640.1 small toxic protein shoB [Salmonella enterica subsp. enterica serovar Sandiego]EAB1813307.1 small toxic protein shoB [Salmonella enterica]EAM1287946.1 small toxic protein shoB [Salmonella enterica]EAM8826808.1 small toxic protein shoB [Salmonella enterica]